MIALIICDECDARLELSEPDVVAAAEVATFTEAHGEHETCAFTIQMVGTGRTLTLRRE